MPCRITVVGTTSWGTTLAVLLARNGNDVVLLARSESEASALTADNENRRHRPGFKFPDSMLAVADAGALKGSDIVLLAVPSATIAANLEHIVPYLPGDATIVSATKGIDPETALRVSEVIATRAIEPERIVALSGPNFAGEIAAGLPAATVVAGAAASRVAGVQAALNSATFRVYTSDDIVGVEIGGALKNVVAIACGLSDGLGYGENARAALITRALAEVTRLGTALGARPMTFLGLAGMGDLILTCQGNQSRNRRLGLALAKGASVEEALASIDGVVEGAVTARAVPLLCQRAGVDMPISRALHDVLYAGKSTRDAVSELMSRAAKPEFEARFGV